jgi:beta-N-acetylhexosaminidase
MPAASSSAASPLRPIKAAIVGISGPELGGEERARLADGNPLGFILFARNCQAPDQVRALVAELRAAVGRPDAPILIDQEGGRVMRLRPPAWPPRVAARTFGLLAQADLATGCEAAWLQARLIAADLAALGITVDCAPVLDLGLPETTEAIGDRAFAAEPSVVTELGRATISGLMDGGILPVIKHLPGHGRARVDSHVELPVVDAPLATLEAADFWPFRELAGVAPMAMSAHVLYPALDPERCATQSPGVIREVIRGAIGFGGLLLSDDLGMGALGGSPGERAARALAAGCDVALHGSGDIAVTAEVLRAAPALDGEAAQRVGRALAAARPPAPFDPGTAQTRLDQLLAGIPPPRSV